MTIVLTAAAVSCGWLFLNILSSERWRRWQEVDAQRRAQAKIAQNQSSNQQGHAGHGEKLTSGAGATKV